MVELNDDDAALAAHLSAIMNLDPAAPALEFEGTWWSWARLKALSDSISEVLDNAGVPAGGEVGLLIRNRPHLVAALLAILSTRRCLVSFNPIEGDVRLAEELTDRRPPVILACAADWARAAVDSAARDAVRVTVDADAGVHALAGSSRQDRPTRPGVAIEMLTSGTTGRPKRVDIRYSKLWNALVSARALEGQPTEAPVPRLRSSVSLIHNPIVHTSGQWRLLETLTAGRRMALLERFTVDGFVDLVVRHRPKTASLVPAAMQMVLDADVSPADFESLRAVVSGTAPLPPKTAEEFERRFGVPVLSVYGATEFAGGIAAWSLEDKKTFGVAKRGSVGRALADIELRVVDPKSGADVATGEIGLLEARGRQLLNDGWIRTTDLASVDEDGFLFLHGRSDSVIVRGGFKVHPEMVEAILGEHAGVAAACVVPVADSTLGHVPVAVVEGTPGRTGLNPDEVMAFARERLTGYQVPVRIVIVDSLPRTPSMKIARGEVARLLSET